jgi:ABC-type transport system involved in cytochrome c biogenesis ATPase subunit
MGERQADIAAIRLASASIQRGNRLVLRDFSFAAEGGDLVWIRGANGSGKSTLLRAIAGLLPLAAGRLEIAGSMALTDENIALDSDCSLDDALRFWARMVQAARSWRQRSPRSIWSRSPNCRCGCCLQGKDAAPRSLV